MIRKMRLWNKGDSGSAYMVVSTILLIIAYPSVSPTEPSVSLILKAPIDRTKPLHTAEHRKAHLLLPPPLHPYLPSSISTPPFLQPSTSTPPAPHPPLHPSTRPPTPLHTPALGEGAWRGWVGWSGGID